MSSVLGVQAHRTQQAVGYIKVTSVKEQLLGTVTEAKAKAEGHSDLEAFPEAWRQRYGIFDPAEDVWHIEFELISKDELTPYKVRQIERGRTSSRLRAAARRQCKEPG